MGLIMRGRKCYTGKVKKIDFNEIHDVKQYSYPVVDTAYERYSFTVTEEGIYSFVFSAVGVISSQVVAGIWINLTVGDYTTDRANVFYSTSYSSFASPCATVTYIKKLKAGDIVKFGSSCTTATNTQDKWHHIVINKSV